MVVDSSAIVAMLLGEPDGQTFRMALVDVEDPVLSVASLLESSIVMYRRAGIRGVDGLDALRRDMRLRSVRVDLDQTLAARRAWVRYGKGNSPAGLNFGDCFSYALARTLDRPLLFKGGDFTRTDVRAAR